MTAFFVFWTLQIYLDWKDKRWENVRLCDPIFADHLTKQRKVEHTFLSSSLSWELKIKDFLEKNLLPKSASCELWQFQNFQWLFSQMPPVSWNGLLVLKSHDLPH